MSIGSGLFLDADAFDEWMLGEFVSVKEGQDRDWLWLAWTMMC